MTAIFQVGGSGKRGTPPAFPSSWKKFRRHLRDRQISLLVLSPPHSPGSSFLLYLPLPPFPPAIFPQASSSSPLFFFHYFSAFSTANVSVSSSALRLSSLVSAGGALIHSVPSRLRPPPSPPPSCPAFVPPSIPRGVSYVSLLRVALDFLRPTSPPSIRAR